MSWNTCRTVGFGSFSGTYFTVAMPVSPFHSRQDLCLFM
jgi:hypothetical protein